MALMHLAYNLSNHILKSLRAPQAWQGFGNSVFKRDALSFRKTKRTCIALIAAFTPTLANAQENASSYTGLWHFHSDGGYKGYLTMDGLGGCSYFMSSAVLTIQATCIVREMKTGGLLVFGTQEGISSTGPTYGDQLANPTQSTQTQAGSTAVTFSITTISADHMFGFLITPSAKEPVRFER